MSWQAKTFVYPRKNEATLGTAFHSFTRSCRISHWFRISPSYTLVHYLKDIDIRDVGSHNAGTLNSYHQLGAWWAILVFMVDAGKAVVATLLPTWVGLPDWSVLVTAPLVIVGHNWTVLLKFRGGKGAACLIGICLALAPASTMIAIVPGVIVLFLSKNAIAGLVAGFAVANAA